MPISLYSRRRPSFDNQLKQLPKHFSGPVYVANNAHRDSGGSKSTATLGPNSFKAMGSDANPKLPKAISAAREAYPDAAFVAGHLLNADFYGAGKNSKNITILTSKANSAHKNFDSPLKDKAGASLKKAYKSLHDAGIDIATVKLGIKVSIEVTGRAWGTTHPDNCIFSRLTCTAKVVRGSRTKKFVNDLIATEQAAMDAIETKEKKKRKRGDDETGARPKKRRKKLNDLEVQMKDATVINSAKEFLKHLRKVKASVKSVNGITVANDPP